MTAPGNRFAVPIDALVGSARVLPQDQVESEPQETPAPTSWDDEQRRLRNFCAG